MKVLKRETPPSAQRSRLEGARRGQNRIPRCQTSHQRSEGTSTEKYLWYIFKWEKKR